MSFLHSHAAFETTPFASAASASPLGVIFDSTGSPLPGMDPFASVMGSRRGSSTMPVAVALPDDDQRFGIPSDSKMVMTFNGQTYSYVSSPPKKTRTIGDRALFVPTWRYEIAPAFHTGKDFAKVEFDLELPNPLPNMRPNSPLRFAKPRFTALAPTRVDGQPVIHTADFVFNEANEDGTWKFVLECGLDRADGSLIFKRVLAGFMGNLPL